MDRAIGLAIEATCPTRNTPHSSMPSRPTRATRSHALSTRTTPSALRPWPSKALARA